MAEYPTYVDLASDARKQIDLNGRWQFCLDPKDHGVGGEWFLPEKTFDNSIHVPGTWQAQGFGQPVTAKDNSCESDVGMKHQYIGTAWYRRTFEAPGEWPGQRIRLKIGGVNPACDIWVNGEFVGSCKQPGIPAAFDVSENVNTGKANDIAVRVHEENRGLGAWFNLTAFWSGLWRKVALEISQDTWIDDLFVVPDIDNSKAVIRGQLATTRTDRENVILKATVGAACNSDQCDSVEMALDMHGRTDFEMEIPIHNMRLWSPADPFLLRAKINLERNGAVVDSASDRFGMRKIEARGGKLFLNNEPVFLRGYGDDGMYPLTLCPDTDPDTLRARFDMIKRYGFNYGYPCLIMQPEEYLNAADEAGIMIQYNTGAALSFERDGGPGELPDVSDEERDRLIEEQWRATLKWTQNHPSIIIYAPGSEIRGDTPQLEELYRIAKQKDPTRLILSWSDKNEATDMFSLTNALFYGQDPAEDLHQVIERWQSPDRKPGILHEYIGSETLPDPGIIRKYEQGNGLSPSKEMQVEANMTKQGLHDLMPLFVANSARLAMACRKIGIEEARKARTIVGYNMWIIQDIPGYPEGIFDPFWQPKHISAREFAASNGQSVLLMNEISCRTRRCFRNGEKTVFEIFLSHHGPAAIDNGNLACSVRPESGATPPAIVEKQDVHAEPFATGKICNLSLMMPEVNEATEAAMTVSLADGNMRIDNCWRLWLFPKWEPGDNEKNVSIHDTCGSLHRISHEFSYAPWGEDAADIVVTDRVDGEVLSYLEDGGTVILLQSGNGKLLRTQFMPHWPFTRGTDVNATIIADHPLMAKFPHDGFCDRQFYHLIVDPATKPAWGAEMTAMGGPAFLLDGVAARIEPIIRVYSEKGNAGYLFEACIGKGKLLATTLRIEHNVGRFPEATYLFGQVLAYATGPDFSPKASITGRELRTLLERPDFIFGP